MALACPSCGTQNPDGNNFCQNCGARLPVAAAVGAAPPPPPVNPVMAAPPPPPGAPVMAPPPPPYQSPYYQPAQPAVVHRTPLGLIVGVVVGLLVLMGGCGVVVAAVAAHPKPVPVAHVAAAPAPTAASTPVPAAVPTAQPTKAPTPQPTTAAATGGGISTKTWSANAAGFKVMRQDDFSALLLTPDGDGSLFIQSGSLQQSTNTNDYLANVIASIGKKYPDASTCLKPTAEAHGGKDGIIAGTCYTYTPQNGKAYRAADVFWVSVSSGNVLYVYEVFTDADLFDRVYNKECLPAIGSIAWKD